MWRMSNTEAVIFMGWNAGAGTRLDRLRAIAAALLSPPLPFGIRHVAGMTRLFTIGLLPAPIRRRYGYAWSSLHEGALQAATLAIRSGLPVLPSLMRDFPHARRAS